MRYRHSFRVRAPLARVADFHRKAESLRLLTPPPMMLRIIESPPILGSADVMRFSMGIGPTRLEWAARIEGFSETGFLDRQLSGPFAAWTHRHTFVPIDAGTTEVRDEIRADIMLHPILAPLGLAMWAGLPALFAYRAFQTRRLLEPRTRRL